MPVTIAAIIEGHGEKDSLPKVLYKIARRHSIWDLAVPTPFRVPRGRLTIAGGLEQAVGAEARRVPGAGGVLVLIDADDDCPAQLGPVLLARARTASAGKPVAVVLAKREFESWFVAAAPSLSSCGFPEALDAPDDPESIRDAKGWLTDHRVDGHPYKPTVDQRLLASAFDIDLARKAAPSFDKFCREVESLLGMSAS